MDDLFWLVRFLLHWSRENPLSVAGFVLAYVMARWLLNRKTSLFADSERVVTRLTEESKGKYKDLRPIR